MIYSASRVDVAEWLRRTPAKCMGSPAQVRILPSTDIFDFVLLQEDVYNVYFSHPQTFGVLDKRVVRHTMYLPPRRISSLELGIYLDKFPRSSWSCQCPCPCGNL